MTTYLHGIRLRNYRGIGDIAQEIGPFKSCNFFIGTNNSGKSCVLNYISQHLAAVGELGNAQSVSLALSPLEIHIGSNINSIEVGQAVRVSDFSERAKKLIFNATGSININAVSVLEELIENISDGSLIWVAAPAANLNAPFFSRAATPSAARPILTDQKWQILWQGLTGASGGGIETWVKATLVKLIPLHTDVFPTAKLIPAKRQIGQKGANFVDFSGSGLIDKLAELQNPGPTERRLRANFEKINSFLQDVTGEHSSTIEIPHDRSEVLVHVGERVLPLSSLGTGIHEVVMIAAFCTLTFQSIVCIEEPEIHLHPLLQKKLIRYLNSKTENQYFIATHSPSVIDYGNAAVFHVSLNDGATKIEPASLPSQAFRMCQDLGYRASDLLQTNAVIWVEGPSDRIYLRTWISAVDASFQEGIHYSIMFYGGRLLSHLTADDDEVSEFISLRWLNRNSAIVIDSDKNGKNSPINETKKRIVAEFEANGAIAWVTAGREIENYICGSRLEEAIASIYPSFSSVQSLERYGRRLHFRTKKQPSLVKTDADKVKVARAVCEKPIELNVLDLKKQVARIVKMIELANS